MHDKEQYLCPVTWNIFLQTPMSRAEYMIIYSKYFSLDIRSRYQIDWIITAYGYVHINTIKGMYGLK